MEKYGKVDSKEIALDYAIRDYELKHLDKIGYGYEIPAMPSRLNYLSNDSWKSFLKEMSPIHKAQFLDGDGGELKEKKGRYGIYPPKMASFGSSSRFIYNLSKNIDNFCFEKALPTRVGHTANLDGYLKKDIDIFVEAKCREIYASHKNTKVNDVYKKVYEYINPDFRYEIEPFDEEYSKYTFYYKDKCIEHFDIKQLICHFLGICANILENNANPKLRFIYLIFNPQKETDFSEFKDKNHRENIYRDYQKTISEIECLGDMKWLFNAVMRYQCENLGKNYVDCDFTFSLADQTTYKSFF